tara:strand:- start:8 stop:676 length:669 start_codon:yes stop_codon:yes gene_type:complete
MKTMLLLIVSFLVLFVGCKPKKINKKTNKYNHVFVDPKDGQEYKTMNIAGLVVFRENYNYKFEDGISSFQCSNFENKEYKKRWGRYYTHLAAESLAPKGWRLPSVKDWEAISKAVGLENNKYYTPQNIKKILKGGSTGLDLEMTGSHNAKLKEATNCNSRPFPTIYSGVHYWLSGHVQNSNNETYHNCLLILTRKKDSVIYEYSPRAPLDQWGFSVRYVKDI